MPLALRTIAKSAWLVEEQNGVARFRGVKMRSRFSSLADVLTMPEDRFVESRPVGRDPPAVIVLPVPGPGEENFETQAGGDGLSNPTLNRLRGDGGSPRTFTAEASPRQNQIVNCAVSLLWRRDCPGSVRLTPHQRAAASRAADDLRPTNSPSRPTASRRKLRRRKTDPPTLPTPGRQIIDRRWRFPRAAGGGIVRRSNWKQIARWSANSAHGGRFAAINTGALARSIASIASATGSDILSNQIRARQDTVRGMQPLLPPATGSIRRVFTARTETRGRRAATKARRVPGTACAAMPRPTPWRPESMTTGQVDCESTQWRAKR